MHGEFLLGAGAVLAALAVAGLLFERLGQSVIPAFILLGLCLRPLHLDEELVEVLATVGVVLLLFFMGLEFSLRALLANRRRILRTGSIDLLFSFPAGVGAGLAFGWGWRGALVAGGALYVTSSAIVAKGAIDLERTANPETETALGVLVFEDLFVALLLAVLSGAVLEGEASAAGVAKGMGVAVAFFGVFVVVALRAGPALDRALALRSDDLLVLAAGGIVLLLSAAALWAGLSEGIGAFLAGMVLAETGHRERIERLFAPLQGVFAAVFFLGFGLSLDPAAFAPVWPQALALAALGVASKVAGGYRAGLADGLSKRSALALGLVLVPRGEFSILLAGVAASAGLARVNAAVGLMVLVLSIAGTVTMQYAPELALRAFPRRAPRPQVPDYVVGPGPGPGEGPPKEG
ncbi:MAG TPA: cation:proton antiporter [Longimicrobium sp.]|nr:cation:proton antiporter [Longimicrobium sp.]